MPDLTLTIPPAVSDRVADAFLASYPPPPGTDVASAPAKLAYVRTLLMNHINAVVAGHEATQASVSAQKAASEKAAKEIILT